MKAHQKGFSVVESLIIIVIVGLLAAAGWFVYDQQKNKTDNAQTNTQTSETEEASEEAKNATRYTFKELGISMGILDGWEVATNHTQSEGVNFYSWIVQKPGADGKIELSSDGFRGGFESCAMGSSLTPATIKDVAPTQNAKLMFMAWSYRSDSLNETANRAAIVLTSQAAFRATNDVHATAIANKDVRPGTYYFCDGERWPGYTLELNDEEAPTFARVDSIQALTLDSTDTNYRPLSTEAQSYAEIKTMLTSIK